MGNERGQEELFGLPYQPAEDMREPLAAAVREHLVTNKLGGMQSIIRFKNAHRYKIEVPRGEDLLRHVTFECRGEEHGFHLLTAFVEMPCRDPDGGLFDVDPYSEIVDLRFKAAEWKPPAPTDKPVGHHRYATEAETSRQPEHAADASGRVAKIGNRVRNQALVILAIGTALLVGETTSGVVSSTWKKAQSVMDRIEGVDEKTRRDPPTRPPLSIPADPWGLSRR
jgi:hypothetical protein